MVRAARRWLYLDYGHPLGASAQPWFELGEGRLYPGCGHPRGINAQPWFQLREGRLYPDPGPRTPDARKVRAHSPGSSLDTLTDPPKARGVAMPTAPDPPPDGPAPSARTIHAAVV
ncbi:hypothetical protein Afe04nite_20150 [Asanoa ferruginea]|nr:hypothetical protein Afe04nite_20150 [Asanoa ferruginea]